MTEQKQTAEESFRSSLEEIIVISEKLTPYCNTVQDLIGMAKLALDNDGQLKLLMASVLQKK